MSKVNRTVLHDTVPTIQYFIDGGTVRTKHDTFYHPAYGLCMYTKDVPFTVPRRSSPTSAGGFVSVDGTGAWVRVSPTNSEISKVLLGNGAVVYNGTGTGVKVGDTIPEGTTHVLAGTAFGTQYLALWEAQLPLTVQSIKDSGLGGTEFIGSNGSVEGVPLDKYNLRKGALGLSKPEPYVEGFGAVDGADCTAAFKAAIQYARKFNSIIRSGAGTFRISERLFFGVLKEADLATPDGFPVNVCLGYAGANRTNTKLVPTASLKDDIVIDMTGMREKYLRNFSIETTSTDCPAVGILTARFGRPHLNSVSNNDWGEFREVSIGKHFSVAAYFAACTEEIYVINCNFRTDQNMAAGAFVSAADLKAVYPTVKEAKETELKFSTGIISNLHQTHINCDYYVGAPAPTNPKIGMIYIRDSLMVNIENPFFNNNAGMIDCVVVDAAPSTAYVYGIHVRNANFHQRTKSGIRFLTPTLNCSLQCSNKTHDFTEGAVVIERYTNGFSSSWLDGDLVIKSGGLVNSRIESVRDLIWNESASIKGSFIGVRGNVSTNSTSRLATNQFELVHKGKRSIISGYYGEASAGALNVQCNKSGSDAVVVQSTFSSFNGNLVTLKVDETGTGFNFLSIQYKGEPLLNVNKQGLIDIIGAGAGLQMRDTSGVKRRLVFNSNGTVSAIPG